MEMSLEVPVIFTAPSATGAGTRTYVTYAPTTIDVRHSTDSETRFVTTIHKPSEKTTTTYRVCDDKWFRRYRWETAGPDAAHRLTQEINVANARKARAELYEFGGPTTPKDARAHFDILAKKYKFNDYQQYLERAASIAGSRDIRQAITKSDDFGLAYEKARVEMRDLAPHYLIIDGEVYERCDGLAIQVCSNVKGDVTISTVELYDGALWRKPVADMKSSVRDADFFYFGIHNREEALAFAQRLSAETGRPLVEPTKNQPALAMDPEELPFVDMRFAELVRSAKNVSRGVGEAIAERLLANPNAIFSDDPSIRYAFDALARILVTVSPFSEVDERLEATAAALVDTVTKDAVATDAMYTGFTKKYGCLVEHLRTCLELWDDRPLTVEMARKAPSRQPNCV
jgi:hypothetical protein